LAILKHIHNLSDESLCDRWLENPYYQYSVDEEFFRHKLSFDRSSISSWCQRMGEERLVTLLQESLAAAPVQVIGDTTVQPKAVALPTDAKLLSRAPAHLVCLAVRHIVSAQNGF
jgi:IS5 family transposase